MKVDDLATTVIKELDLYQMRLNEGISDVFDDASDVALKTVRSNSQTAGFNDRKYSSGWVKSVRHDLKGAYRIHGVVIHNKKHYRLTHLLEKPHQLRNGGQSPYYPHIQPTQDYMDRWIVSELKEKIEETK